MKDALKRYGKISVPVLAALGLIVALIFNSGGPLNGERNGTRGRAARPDIALGPEPPLGPAGPSDAVWGIALPAVKRLGNASYKTVDPFGIASEVTSAEVPGPAGPSPYGRGKGLYAGADAPTQLGSAATSDIGAVDPPQPAAPALSSSFDTTGFNDNSIENGGYLFIPPDSRGAAGMDHLVNVVNTVIRFHEKDGTLDYTDSLKDFFTSLSPVNFTFDPKVVYDQLSDRFVVVTLEVVDGSGCSSNDNACRSRLLVAVSDDGDPNGTWYMTAIDSEVSISGADYWLDYPGLAVDEEAIYVTGNLFRYSSEGGAYGGSRLWVIAKGEGSGGLYDGGGSVSYADYNPYAVEGIATTTQPAHVFGASDPSLGTYLVAYSGLSDGTNEYVEVVRLDNPLGVPVFTQQYVAVGNIDNTASALPDAAQLGTTETVRVNDRRALGAVWRDGLLYLTATIKPESGADAGQTTAHWWSLDTTTTVPGSIAAVEDQGDIGGEDIATGTATFFPSIAVNDLGDLVVGFSASASTIYPGAYYTSRLSGDAPGTTSGSEVLRAGIDYYYRAFGGSNRWGDYSGAMLDPDTGCFWVYNQYASTRGTVLGSYPTEDGRWTTAFGEVCLTEPCPTDVVIDSETFAAGSHVVLAANSITVTGNTTVVNGGDLSLQAGNHIGFGPGFAVQFGGVLTAVTGTNPCL